MEDNAFVIGRRLGWGTVLLLILNFFSIIWYARGLDARVSFLEQRWDRAQSSIDSLDVIAFRQSKISDLLQKLDERTQVIQREIEVCKLRIESRIPYRKP